MKINKVLIVSSKEDTTTDCVQDWLYYLKIPVDRINGDSINDVRIVSINNSSVQIECITRSNIWNAKVSI